MFVYVIVNSVTLKIYIGQHKGNNLQKYLRQKLSHAVHGEAAGSRLYNSMRKHPKSAWSIHSLISDLQTREECDDWERRFIRALNAQHTDIGYNIGSGGESAPCGNTHGQGNKGRAVSDEWRHRLSAAATQRWASQAARQEQHYRMQGVAKPPRSESHRQHLSESLMGRRASAEQVLHQSLAQKGKPKKPRTAEHIHNNAAATRAYWAAKRILLPVCS